MGAKKLAQKDGGYYAIKGFVFQFDKSIFEALLDPSAEIEIEQIQDIATSSYYIQVKHKESQCYTLSKIRPAIKQLIEEAQLNKSKEYILYCHFKDKVAQKLSLDIKELNKILGQESGKYTDKVKTDFLKVFCLEFSENFQKQFEDLLKQIKKSFSLKGFEEAAMYHATFRASLMGIAILKNADSRKISFSRLRNLLDSNERIIFEIAYPKYLTNKKYLIYLKKEYFTHKKVNIKDHERLLNIAIDEKISDSDIFKIIICITNKYYIQDNSGAPYVCLSGIDRSRNIKIKQKLWSTNFLFSDGTHFSGDSFHVASITEKFHKLPRNKVKCKLIDQADLEELLNKHAFDEVFSFLTPTNIDALESKITAKKFYLNQTRDILKIIE